MHSFVLQDWTTIRGAASTNVIQSESAYLDLSSYQDVILWVDCREFTGSTPAISFQTAPTKDETLFLAGTISGPNNFTTAGVQLYKVILSSVGAGVPLSRWLRWYITGAAAAWDATFRVLVAANSPGM